jgi:hypothetical protein
MNGPSSDVTQLPFLTHLRHAAMSVFFGAALRAVADTRQDLVVARPQDQVKMGRLRDTSAGRETLG